VLQHLHSPHTQVVGPAGLGKTQLCLQLAVMGCLEREAEGGAVAFIDTEKKFSARR
jgi:RAD51-like protein 1